MGANSNAGCDESFKHRLSGTGGKHGAPWSETRSVVGQTRRIRDVRGMSGPLHTVDISGPGQHFAFVPGADLPTAGVAQLIQKLFGRDQIGGVETLREAVVDRLEAGGGVGGAALLPQQAGKARRGAQLP